MIGTASVTTPVAVGEGAAQARRVLEGMLRRLDGSRSLVVAIADGRIPPLVERVGEGRLTATDERALDRQRQGLDAIGGRGASRSAGRG